LAKAPTGIPGLDAITGGGLPRGRPALVCGGAGCGKTLLAMEFLVRGASEFGEPGVFMAFEETPDELSQNVRSLGFDVDALVARGMLLVDHVQVDRSQIEESGDYDLEGLFIRLGSAIDAIGAKRVALDTLEVLFASFGNEGILRAELRRLFRWLKDRGVTAIITAERGDGTLTRHGLEEYVSDCVILLDHRVVEQIASRRLRIVKYRGSSHGTNEYPFLISEAGIEVLPITSVGLDHPASTERLSTGVPALDEMLGGRGLFRGSTVLLSGTAGTGKTSLAAQMAEAACRRGERCLYLAFEESRAQLVRNMRSIGLDLDAWVRRGLLRFEPARPTLLGLEAHLTRIYRFVRDFEPGFVVVDPITNLAFAGSDVAARGMLMRLIDFLKSRQITVLLTSLTAGGSALEKTDANVSSLVDTWILLREIEWGGERNRGIYVLKSRGMAHSNQVREFRLTKKGIRLTDAYLGTEGVLAGSARLAQEAREKASAAARQQDLARQRRRIGRRRMEIEAEIGAKRRALEAEVEDLDLQLKQDQFRETALAQDRLEMARSRKAQPPPSEKPGSPARRRRGPGTPKKRPP
jgi:circadian clock protein KaiC